MKLEIGKNKDFWAGLMFLVTGAFAMFVARDYQFGSVRNMGSGFFPMILGGVLVAFGICIMAAGLRSNEKIRSVLSFRALIMLPLSLILFTILMDHAGAIPALMALVFAAAAAGREFKFLEVLLLALVLTAASVALFIWGIGLSHPLVKGF